MRYYSTKESIDSALDYKLLDMIEKLNVLAAVLLDPDLPDAKFLKKTMKKIEMYGEAIRALAQKIARSP